MKKILNKSPKMLEIESERGECIEEVIRKLYVDDDLRMSTFCEELSISYVTGIKWLLRAGVYSRKLDI